MERIRALVHSLLESLWFIPAVIVCGSMAAAVGLIELESLASEDLGERLPRLFGAGAEGARGMLQAIAGSMITVAGVVFSVTVVALSLASSQYSPRVLRTFMADRPTQVVFGVFVGVFAYCIVVLRTIREPDEIAFVPSLAVMGGVFGALAGVALLVYFIHHLATAIQAPYIIARIAQETAESIDRLFPADVGRASAHFGRDVAPGALPEHWHAIPSAVSGYLVRVEGDRLIALADEADRVVRLAPHMGDFVIEGRPLAWVSGLRPPDERLAEAVREAFGIGRERSVLQDAPFGVQQLVDIALRALSPGVHDPTTATSCIDHLGALLCRLSERRIEGPYRCSDARLRVIAEGPGYADLVGLAFGPLTDHAGDHVEVCERLLSALAAIGSTTGDAQRRAVLARHVDAVLQRVARLDTAAERRLPLLERGRALKARLEDGEGPPEPAARPLPGVENIQPRTRR